MKLWSDRFKPHIPFYIARRNHLQTKWDHRRNDRGNRVIVGIRYHSEVDSVLRLDPSNLHRSDMVCR